jgi:S1 RNA binding domain
LQLGALGHPWFCENRPIIDQFCSFLRQVWNHFDSGTCPGKAVGVKIRLDNGVTGFVAIKNLSDSMVINPAERVKPGNPLLD